MLGKKVHGGEARRGGCPKPTLVSLRLGDTNGATLKLPGIGVYLNFPSLSLRRRPAGSESVHGRQIALIPGLLSIIVPSHKFNKIGPKEVVTNPLQPKIKLTYLVPHLAFRTLGSKILNPFNIKFLAGVTSDRPTLDELLNPKNKPTQVGYSPTFGSARSPFAKYINPLRLPFLPGSGGISPRGIISILLNPLNIKSLPWAGVTPPRSMLGNFVNPYKLPLKPFSGDDVPRNLFSVIINPLNIRAFAGEGKQKSPSFISSFLNPLNIIGLAGASGGQQGLLSMLGNMIQDASLHKGLLSAISRTIGINVSRRFGLMALITAVTAASLAFPVISTILLTRPFSFKIHSLPKIKMIV